MGVASIWDQIRPGQDERIPLRLFATNFSKKHNRPLRVAIDGYMMLFEASLGSTSNGPTPNLSKFALNIMSKMRLFLSTDITFIVVFDGKIKPPKRGDSIRGKYYTATFEDLEREYNSIIESGTYSDHFREVELMRSVLELMNIQYMDAPGEAEAQCAWLQSEGYVDYVITNDSDVLINGATKVLKNLSKFVDDHAASARQTSNDIKETSRTEFFVTPIDMEKVQIKTGFTRERLLLYAILIGGDYNSKGVTNIGDEKAKRIVLCGTEFLTDKDPNFLYNVDFVANFMKVYSGSVSHFQRVELYDRFQQELFLELTSNMKAYFKKNYSADSLGLNFPPDCIVMFYIKPFVFRKPFHFERNRLNNTQTHQLLPICQSKGSKLIEFFEKRRKKPSITKSRLENGDDDDAVQEGEVEHEVNIKDFGAWMNEALSEALLTRVIKDNLVNEYELIHFDSEKVIDFQGLRLPLLGARVRPFFKFNNGSTDIMTDVDLDVKPKLIWVLRDSIPETNILLIEYEDRKQEKEAEKLLQEEEKRSRAEERERRKEERKNSPKKTPSPRKSPRKQALVPQSSTLATLGFISPTHKSPTKVGFKVPDLSHEPGKLSFQSPAKLFEAAFQSPKLLRQDSISSMVSHESDIIQSANGDSVNNSPNRKLDFTSFSSPIKKIDTTKEKPTSPGKTKLFSRSSSIRSTHSPSISPPGKIRKFYAPADNDDIVEINPFLTSSNLDGYATSQHNSPSKLKSTLESTEILDHPNTSSTFDDLNSKLHQPVSSTNSFENPILLDSNEPTPKINKTIEMVELLSSDDGDDTLDAI